MPLGAIAAIGGIAGAASSYFGGKKADRAAKRAAEQQRLLGIEQSNLIGMETEETQRRFDKGVASTLSTGRALAAASGFGGKGSSSDNFLTNMATEYRSEREWMSRSGKQRQKSAKMGAQYTSDSLRSQGKQALYAGVAGAIGGISTAAGYMA